MGPESRKGFIKKVRTRRRGTQGTCPQLKTDTCVSLRNIDNSFMWPFAFLFLQKEKFYVSSSHIFPW